MQFKKPEIIRGPFPERQKHLWKIHKLNRQHSKLKKSIAGTKTFIEENIEEYPDLDNGLVSLYEKIGKKQKKIMDSVKKELNDFKSFKLLKEGILDCDRLWEQLERLDYDHTTNVIREGIMLLIKAKNYVMSPEYQATVRKTNWEKIVQFVRSLKNFFRNIKKAEQKVAF